jgi:hypothetical protein
MLRPRSFPVPEEVDRHGYEHEQSNTRQVHPCNCPKVKILSNSPVSVSKDHQPTYLPGVGPVSSPP